MTLKLLNSMPLNEVEIGRARDLIRRWLGLLALLALVTPDPSLAAPVQYTYDSADRLVAADYGGGKVTVFTYDANGNLLNRVTALATNADVRLSKTSDFTGITVGNNLNFTLTVSNAGPDAATGVTVTDPLPFGLLFSSAGASQGSVSVFDRTLIGSLGVLPAGANATITFAAFHGITNTTTNIATGVADQMDPVPANNIASRVTSGLGPITDTDGDGLPDWWETRYGMSTTSTNGVNGANGDPDGDGVRNLDEFIADTNPQDPNSNFRFELLTYQGSSPGKFTFSFLSSPIRAYRAFLTDDLTNALFTNLQSFNGSGLLMSVTDTNSLSNRSYRIDIRVPPP